MALKQKGGGAKSIPVGLAISWAVQISLTMGLCLLLAALILSGKAGQETLAYSVPAILIVSAYMGAAVSCKLVGHHNMVLCLSSAALYLGTLLAIALLVFDGEISAFWVADVGRRNGCNADLQRTERKRGSAAKKEENVELHKNL